MSADPTVPSNGSALDPMDSASAALLEGAAATPSKGKDRASVEHLAEEGADDDSSDEEEEAEEDDAIEEDDLGEIDPGAILAPGARRSTRGAAVNYASAEALEKAGLKPEDLEEEQEESYVADDKMEDD